MRRLFSFGRSAVGLSAMILAATLVGCNGGSDGGGGGTTPPPVEPPVTPPPSNSGTVIQGPEGTAIAIPSDPSQIVAINATIDLSQTVAVNPATGNVTVHFFLKDDKGAGISLTQNPVELRFYLSELAVDRQSKVDPGLAWNQLISESGTPGDAEEDQLPGLLTVIDGGTGEYKYRLGGTLAASANVNRVTVRARWRATIGDTRYYIVNSANASYDFMRAAAGAELAASGADMVDTKACDSCHGVRIGGVGHGGGYTEVKTCNNCHNINYMDEATGHTREGDLAYMVHRIHNAGAFAVLDDGIDFSHLTYPQETSTCDKCHNDSAPNANLAFTNPTRRNCSSCHANVNFETGENHEGGAFMDDTLCSACHQKNGSDINGGIPGNDHKSRIAGSALAEKPANVPEFDVSIGMTPPANGEYYVAGETPTVRVTLKNHANGQPVNEAIYTAAMDAKGVVGGGLSGANLYVYGPRSGAVPVLTTGSTTDGGIQQGHPLFVGGTDPQVRSDATGFKYKLMDNIGDLAPGTYMVRFEGGDYGAISDTDYRTASTQLINFQVGQAEEEPKISGDACTNCHGDTKMHLEGAHPHNQGFDVDGCLSCHDLSGNYGDYIGNRVHAVHSASLTGDLKHRDWTHVTFPQDPNNCGVCHTNPNANPPVWETTVPVACGGCHGADPNAQSPDPSDSDLVEKALKESVAASHMILMGADFTDPAATPGCLVCHGEGQEVDLYKKHNLINYAAPDGGSVD